MRRPGRWAAASPRLHTTYPPPRPKGEARQSLRAKSAQIAAREAELRDGESAPRSAEDFERLLLGSPNASYVWVQFMTFQLSLAEIDRAREATTAPAPGLPCPPRAPVTLAVLVVRSASERYVRSV